MALLLFRVGALLGVVAWSLAIDQIELWYNSVDDIEPLSCIVPNPERLQLRKPPPPLVGGDHIEHTPYLWRHNGRVLNTSRVSSNGTLTYKSAGLYQCQVRSNGSIVLGYPQRVAIAEIGQFGLLRRNVSVMIGQPTYLRCDIKSSPEANFTWIKNGDPVKADNDRIYILQNVLLITEVLKVDEGSYRCIATNKYIESTKSWKSERMKLTITTNIDNIEPYFLLKDRWKEREGDIGGTVLLPCLVAGHPRPEIMWQFHPSSGDRAMELDTVSQVLERSQLSLDQDGMYTCSVIGKELQRNFSLRILEVVHITHPPLSREQHRASTVRFNCSAIGNPKPQIEWYKNGEKINSAGRIRYLPSVEIKYLEQLVINSITKEDEGIYQCFAKNTHSIQSEWATLTVTGTPATAPYNVTCIPIDESNIKIKWKYQTKSVVAYTVHMTSPGVNGTSLPLQPVQTKYTIIPLSMPLTPYKFQVRGYLQSAKTLQYSTSDLSETITCQTEQVPLEIRKSHDGDVIVSWSDFARKVPDIKYWRLQFSPDDSHKNFTETRLSPDVTNYLLPKGAYNNMTITSVRVLGSTDSNHTQQWDMSHVRWTNVSSAGLTLPVPSLNCKWITSSSVLLAWSPIIGVNLYIVCLSNITNPNQKYKCKETERTQVSINNLTPETEYEAVIRTEGGDWSAPLVFFTLEEEKTQQYIEVNYTYIDLNTIKVHWKADPSINTSSYIVHYSPELTLPVDKWKYREVVGNTVVLTGLDPYNQTFVMVAADASTSNKIITIPAQKKAPENLINWYYEGRYLMLHKSGFKDDKCTVAWTQDLVQSIETWPSIKFDNDVVEIPVQDVSVKTFLSVLCGGSVKMFTIPPDTTEKRPNIYFGIVVACSICLMIFIIIGAIFFVRSRRKPRTRRRHPTTDNDEDGAELKCMGSRLANGAGQPLLNGHVHITENPAQSKTPNGKLLKVCFEEAFDLSRVDDLDQTMETTLDSTNSTQNMETYVIPDSNMNCEITQFGDTSKAQPILQPNG